MTIRKALLQDVEKIWELGDVKEFETSEDIVTFWPKSILENCINKLDVMILVLEEENIIIGFMITNINSSLKKAELENIYVMAEYRCQGYGKALLQRTIEELAKLEIENVCAMSNDAVDFLLKNNFTKGNQFYWMDLALSDRFIKENR